MAVPGAYFRSHLGADATLMGMANAGGNTGRDMNTTNIGWCARFTAIDTRDVKSVYVNWATVSTPGTITLTIETIDATTGKPTGSLYDAAATKTFTPSAGWQLVTFDVLPTTGLTAGTEYAVVLICATTGTTQNLRSHTAGATPGGVYPSCVLLAADGTTRSNFAETGAGVPVCTLIMDDDVEEVLTFHQHATLTSYNLSGTIAAGQKFVVPTGVSLSVAGVYAIVQKVGTPAGDLRARIFNSSDAAVSGTTVTADKDSLLTSLSNRIFQPRFATPVTLAAGTYRIVLDSGSSANSSNCWRVYGGVARAAGNVPSSCIVSSTADVTAGTISWTDTSTEQFVGGLVIDSLPAGSGSGGVIGGPNLRAGMSA